MSHVPYYGETPHTPTHTKGNQNMNPFQVRLEVLKMAKEMMDRNYDEMSNAFNSTIFNLAQTWNKSAEEMIEQVEKMRPTMYDPADMIKKAQELYGFVSEKK